MNLRRAHLLGFAVQPRNARLPPDHFLATGERGIDHYVTRRVINDVLDRRNQLGSLDNLNKDYLLGFWEYDG